MPALEDLTGLRFNRLTVTAMAPRLRTGRKAYARVECVCDCGAKGIYFAANLKEGKTKSCGCHRASRLLTSGVPSTGPECRAWHAMKHRCANPRNARYADYGGRGLRVCAEWLASFDAFLACVGTRPSARHSLDRINNDGNYEPGNVRWATASEQANNRRAPRPSRTQ